jgi:hypothetical protein
MQLVWHWVERVGGALQHAAGHIRLTAVDIS